MAFVPDAEVSGALAASTKHDTPTSRIDRISSSCLLAQLFCGLATMANASYAGERGRPAPQPLSHQALVIATCLALAVGSF
jgi:hypothetical protein